MLTLLWAGEILHGQRPDTNRKRGEFATEHA